MSFSTLSQLLVIATTLSSVYAQSSTGTSLIPLASKRIPYNEIVRHSKASLDPRPHEISSRTKWIQQMESVDHNRVIICATLLQRVKVPCAKLPI